MDAPLSLEACRVLGSLLEKERTVPAGYPMTPNALRTACNQTTGRDPVLDLDDRTVGRAVDELRQAGLVRIVHPSHGVRTEKVRQVADEVLELGDDERAALTVLLLRGPQTVGELRARGERLHDGSGYDDVQDALERLAARPEPLVRLLPRQPGQKDPRWIHLLAGEPTEPPTVSRTSAPSAPPPLGIELAVLAPFVGTWVGEGHGTYPTIEPFGYTEELTLAAVPGKPFLAYRSATRATDDGRPLHGEVGFLRVAPSAGPDAVELVLAAGPGLVEVCEGLVDAGTHPDDATELLLGSTSVAGTATAKEVTATERRYRVHGDVLSYELGMAAVGQPLLPHLRARLRRQ